MEKKGKRAFLTLKILFTGYANNGFDRHNAGLNAATKPRLPWKLVISYPCNTRSEAMILEKKIKKRRISRFLTDQNSKLN